MLLLLLLSVYLFLLTPFGQNWMTQRIVGYLAGQWDTRIELKNARFSLFDRVKLEGLTIYDSRSDTLLHAGLIQVHISNWFFLRDQNDLGPIRLENALLKIQRTDSLWQHEKFLSQFKGSGNQQSKGTGSGSRFNLRELELINIRFIQDDKWEGNRIDASVGELTLLADRLDPADSVFYIRQLIVSEPHVSIETFNGKRPNAPAAPQKNLFEWMPTWAGPAITVDELQLEKGRFEWMKQTVPKTPSVFNTSRMRWTDLQVKINHLKASEDSLSMPFDLSGNESSGLQIKNLSGQLLGYTKGWQLKNFGLNTAYSSLKQDLYWVHTSEGNEIQSEIKEGRISPADIKTLTGKTLPITDDLLLQGGLRIGADRMTARSLWAQWGNALRLSGEISGNRWRSKKDWSWTFDKAEIFVGTDAITKWISLNETEKSYLKKIGFAQIRGKGQISATKGDWEGSIRSQFGSLYGKAGLQFTANQPIRYQLNLRGQLDGLAGIIPETGIRSAKINLSVEGAGKERVQASGEISELQTRSYRYEPIRFALQALDPDWQLRLDTKDPNLNGVVQLSGDPFSNKPVWDLDARLEWMDLTKLGWNPDGLTLKGSLRGQFSGNGLNDLNGTLQGHALELSRNEVPLSLQDFDLTLQQYGKTKNISLRSNEIDGDINGRFSWTSLPALFIQVGHQHFPSWIKAPNTESLRDSIDFSIHTYNIESYLELLHLPFSGLSNAQINGNIRPDAGITQLRASLPNLKIGKYQFKGAEWETNGDQDSIRLTAKFQQIQLNDSISIPEASINVTAHRDTADIRLLAGLPGAVDKADIRSRLISYPDGLRLDLSPSTFLIQGKLWSIDENGQLVIRKGEPAIGNLTLREGDQRIEVRTVPSKTSEDNDIEVSIESLNLHDIAPYFLPANELEGLLSAKLRLTDPAGTLRIEADSIRTRLLRFDADSIGELGAALAFDPVSNKLSLLGGTLNPAENLTFDANIFINGPLDSNRVVLKANAYPIKILERFLGHLFSDIRGKLTGEVELSGDLNNPTLYGKGRLSGAGLRVDYTNCFYSIQDADIEITPTLIDLDGWVLKDSATGNPIYLRGGIAHESFRNMYYDLSATTRSPLNGIDRPVLLLNTDRNQEEVYYGNARGTLNLQLRGPQTDLFLNMQARASDRDSSYLTLLSEDGRESGDADFLIEREYGREMSGKESRGVADNFTVDIEITATPLVNAKVVLDELTGDVIRGRGSGTLKLRSGSNEPLSLRGRYNIEEGNYLFTFQSFFKKPFEIKKGGQHYVEWSGDPYDANIKLEAVYRAEKVSFAPLANSLNINNSMSNARGDVFVNAELSGKLFQPQIQFTLGFPPNSVVDRNQELALLINQLQKNPNELNRQVTYLIVFNSFAPSELAGDPTGTGIGVSTISGVLLNVLSDQINKLLGNLLKSDKYTINLNTSLYNRDWMAAGNNALNLGSNINFSIGRSFFNNRFVISGGLGFDAPLGQSTTNANLTQSIQLLPDVTMEWLLNPSGSLRVGFFYRKSNDFLTNNTNPITARRTGGSLSYQKDYDHLGDLFRGLFRKKKKE